MKTLTLAALLTTAALPAFAQTETPAADVELWRLDCGDVKVNDLNLFSDTRAYTGETRDLTASCYLIRHGTDYMIWDTGLPAALKGAPQNDTDALSPTLKTTIEEQLTELDLTPADIGRVGISHYHFDHTGQAASFPDAELMIDARDWDVLSADPLPTFAEGFANPDLVKPWLDGGKLTTTTGDTDVFGDGSVTMLTMPGHTPGSLTLLVQLAETGPVLLSGDIVHFEEQIANQGVPTFNTDRSDTLSSIDRMNKLAGNLGATLVIQHDPRDIEKLPAFPASAK
ncbi:N-acyl homoserine lactonase family protein [Loktanella sp. M215]|uniref:N-acyl homoserine lactonase family protein n=1 Tax=Loktanella sp. M215 TaxID=2675431 RepID=UPI001F2F8C1B|nr:N-acyl homoserine lactonase family protein [Loktanella sp. M215]MCF7699526.1 MBL fold metallo-hydrolase [Loktanella sp. M215]